MAQVKTGARFWLIFALTTFAVIAGAAIVGPFAILMVRVGMRLSI